MNPVMIIVPFFLLPGKKELQSADIVKITVPEIVVHAGESSVIKIKIEIKKGYHIQANKVNDEYLVPTILAISDYKTIKPGIPQYPRSKKIQLEDTDIFLDIYDGVFEIKIPVTVAKEIPKGKHRIKGTLQYQACDNKICLFPKTIAFSFTIKVI